MTSVRQLTRQPTESELQAQICEGLDKLGYEVLQTGRPPKPVQCPSCGHWHTPKSGTNNSKGINDLFATLRKHRRPIWTAMELKVPALHTLLGSAPAGRLRPEQRALVEAGLIVCVHSLEECLAALEGKED